MLKHPLISSALIPCLFSVALQLDTRPVQAADRRAAPRQLAPTPPLGWNSWDSYGLTITEEQFRDNVAVLAKTLRPYGWQYAVIDEGWFMKNPLEHDTPGKLMYEIDANGRYDPVPARFPSAMQGDKNTGFASLGAYVHSLGLKFGIHIVRGVPKEAVSLNTPIAGSHFHAKDVADTADACPWDPTNWGVRDTPAGQAWYDALMAQYAAWGVDFLKVDCISDHPYRPGEISMIHQAVLKTGRPMLLSLSPGPTSPALAETLPASAQMWRMSDDIWDDWVNPKHLMRSIRDQFTLAAAWAPYAGPGSWPDADMLPLGYLGPVPGEGDARETKLTHDEQQTMLTLWAMARSPLILGANLTKLDDWTKSLVTNQAILEIDQSGHDQRQVAREGGTAVWASKGAGNVEYLALFNLNDTEKRIDRSYAFYDLQAAPYRTQDLWKNEDRGVSSGVDVTLPPHACLLLKLTPAKTTAAKSK